VITEIELWFGTAGINHCDLNGVIGSILGLHDTVTCVDNQGLICLSTTTIDSSPPDRQNTIRTHLSN
jgi:hypothetical protein